MARLYMDEDTLHPDLAQNLREKGHDVLTANQAGNSNKGYSDNYQLKYASENDRIIVTNNRSDYNIEHLESSGHKGIISGKHFKDQDKFSSQIDAIVNNNNLENVNIRANTNDFIAENKAGEKQTYKYEQPKIDPIHIQRHQSQTPAQPEPPEPTKPGASQIPPTAEKAPEPEWKAKWASHTENTKIPDPPQPSPDDVQTKSKGRGR